MENKKREATKIRICRRENTDGENGWSEANTHKLYTLDQTQCDVWHWKDD